MNSYISKVLAVVVSIPESEGGNPSSFYKGYRAVLHYDGSDEGALHGVQVDPIDGELESGKSGKCVVQFLFPEYHKQFVKIGAKFELRDGNTPRANGEIIELQQTGADGSRRVGADGDNPRLT